MKKLRGLKLGHKLVKAVKWILRPRRRYAARLFSLIRRAKRLCRLDRDPTPGKTRLGRGISEKDALPKGYTAVYVGEPNGDTCRVVVPVMYLNHPLFGELLKESERTYGFDHAGGITIPYRVSDFQKVQMKIAAWDHCPRRHLRLR